MCGLSPIGGLELKKKHETSTREKKNKNKTVNWTRWNFVMSFELVWCAVDVWLVSKDKNIHLYFAYASVVNLFCKAWIVKLFKKEIGKKLKILKWMEQNRSLPTSVDSLKSTAYRDLTIWRVQLQYL